jgi:hypothetical protein
VAFVFDGLAGETFGHQGAWGGGASGWEIDRSDADLGTPAGTWWLARSEGPRTRRCCARRKRCCPSCLPFRDAKARSDMVLAPVGRGDVFAVGSMTWIGALHGPDGATDRRGHNHRQRHPPLPRPGTAAAPGRARTMNLSLPPSSRHGQ